MGSNDVELDILKIIYSPLTVPKRTQSEQPPQQSLAQEHGKLVESLPLRDLTTEVLFAGKVYQDIEGASDHVGHPNIFHYYSKRIILSEWASLHIYDNPPRPIQLEPSPFEKEGYKIFGTQGGTEHINTYNLEWRTEGDWDIERGKTTKDSRRFPSTEVRIIKNSEAIELLAAGYDLYSKLSNIRNLNWISGEKVNSQDRRTNARNIKSSAIETVTITNQVDSLWNDKKRLEDDNLVSFISNGYLSIEQGKNVVIPKINGIDTNQSILIAQAISQMFAAKHNKLIGWVTERGILGSSDRNPFAITFSLEPKVDYLQTNEVFISPAKNEITDKNRDTVESIRKIFSGDLPVALEKWKSN